MPRAWWLPPSGAAAAVTLAVVAATGCAASGGLHASPPPSTKSPIATAAVSTPGHAPQAATIGDPDICADVRQTSEGAEYSAYLLAANREHWYFTGIAKVHGALLRLCHQESPAPTPSPSHM